MSIIEISDQEPFSEKAVREGIVSFSIEATRQRGHPQNACLLRPPGRQVDSTTLEPYRTNGNFQPQTNNVGTVPPGDDRACIATQPARRSIFALLISNLAANRLRLAEEKNPKEFIAHSLNFVSLEPKLYHSRIHIQSLNTNPSPKTTNHFQVWNEEYRAPYPYRSVVLIHPFETR